MTLHLTAIHHPHIPSESHAQQTHELVVYLTEGSPPEPRCLWSQPTPGVLLVQSPVEIGPQHLPPPLRSAHMVSRAVDLDWTAGARVSWSCIAHPMVTTHKRDSAGKMIYRPSHGSREQRTVTTRRDLSEGEAVEWISDKLSPGITVDRASVGVQRISPTVMKKPRHRAVFPRLVLSGTGVVADPAALAGIMTCGIGKHRAYGGGLILVEQIDEAA